MVVRCLRFFLNISYYFHYDQQGLINKVAIALKFETETRFAIIGVLLKNYTIRKRMSSIYLLKFMDDILAGYL